MDMGDRERTVLVVGPHPDDVELGMGGTLLKMIRAGWRVVVVDLTNGEPTPFGSEETRARETVRASAVLGVEDRLCLGMTNRYLEVTADNRRALAEVIRLRKPVILFGPYGPDDHPDHTEAARLVDVCRFQAKLHKTDMRGHPHWTRRLYQYHPIHSSCWGRPLFIIDVTDVWDQKIGAIQAYESQLKNHCSSAVDSWLDRTAVICRYFGQLIGCRYGEAFFGQEPLGSEDLLLLAELHRTT